MNSSPPLPGHVQWFPQPAANAIDAFNEVKQEINLAIIDNLEKMKIKLAGNSIEIIGSIQL